MPLITFAAKRSGTCACGASVPVGTRASFDKDAGWAIKACPACKPSLGGGGAQGGDGGGEQVDLVFEVAKVRSLREAWAATEALFPEGAPAGAPKVTRFAAVGRFSVEPHPGDHFAAKGVWNNDPRWGWEFKIAGTCTLHVTKDDKGMARLLTRMKGVGPKRARELLDVLGGPEGVEAALTSNPAALMRVRGVTMEAAQAFAAEWASMGALNEARKFLASLPGLGDRLQARLLSALGVDAEVEIKNDPFVCMDHGLPFTTCDAIASHLKFTYDDPRRLRAAVGKLVNDMEAEGHTWMPIGAFVELGRTALRYAPDMMHRGLALAQAETRRGGRTVMPTVIVRGDMVLSARMERAEADLTSYLTFAADGGADAAVPLSEEDLALVFARYAAEGKPLSSEQQAAVRLALTHRVMVLTGGPGRGKTHVTNAILAALEAAGIEHIACAAPTGKAAVRLSELTGRPASTIHRLLEYGPIGGPDRKSQRMGFRRNESEPTYDENGRWLSGGPVEVDAVVVDEASMIDVELGAALVRALRGNHRLIIVGDADQLPSIGAGQFLADVIASGKVAVARLTTIFRQAADSGIPWVAKAINEGDAGAFEDYLGGAAKGVSFEAIADTEAVATRIVDMVAECPSRVVISPMKSDNKTCGTFQLNGRLQERLNPAGGRPEVRIGGGYVARAGDRVIQTANNYDLRVFNGETGIVLSAGKAPVEVPEGATATNSAKAFLVVDYTTNPNVPRVVAYTLDDANDLQLAYAVTGHRYQGSQAPEVLIPMVEELGFMLRRRWTYTAVTRAAESLVLLGEVKMLRHAATHEDEPRRTTLCARLTTGLPDITAPVVTVTARPAANPTVLMSI